MEEQASAPLRQAMREADLQAAPLMTNPPVEKPKPKDAWDKADILGKLLGSMLIPFAVAIAGFYINGALQDRAAKQKTIEIAVAILQSDNSSTPELKEWAEGVFNANLAVAGQPLSAEARQELRLKRLPSNSTGADLVAEFEGFSPKPVKSSSGQWVIGFGHTEGVGPDTPPITPEQGRDLLTADLKKASDTIDRLVKVQISANQREALVSFVWNVGEGAFARSSLLKALNSGHYDKIPDELRNWNWEASKRFPGIAARRKREIEIWIKQ